MFFIYIKISLNINILINAETLVQMYNNDVLIQIIFLVFTFPIFLNLKKILSKVLSAVC